MENELEIVRSRFRSLKLLCVEDTETTLLIYKAVFDPLFKEVFVAKNGQEALEILQKNKIDIVLSDYEMPVMNGIEMITEIRKSDLKIPIILVTGISDVDIVIEALRLRVSNFLQKPIDVESLLEVMDRTVKLIIADETIKKENQEKLKALQKRDEYLSYQEELGFLKELNILKNDFYYQKVGQNGLCLVDFIYMPLDTLSGDAYSARCVGCERYFYLIVDGMGKGISASFTSVLMTSFINYKIDKMIAGKHGFDLHYLVKESIQYIQAILLEYEILAISFVELNVQKKEMNYALFSMPPMLLEKRDGSVTKIVSNNAPLSSYTTDFKVSTYSIKDVVKYLIHSDGLNENSLKNEEDTYSLYIQEDFKNSFTREDFKNRFLKRVNSQEDDITVIFLHHIDLKHKLITEKRIQSSMSEVEETQEWYENFVKQFTDDEAILNNMTLTFTEMILNAHEHGNMSIDYSLKHKMISDGSYWTRLEELEEKLSKVKQIDIKIYKINYGNNQNYLVTNIEDEGKGFDTQILIKILRNRDSFNGKGVYISRKSSSGIYYNRRGNDVLFIHKI